MRLTLLIAAATVAATALQPAAHAAPPPQGLPCTFHASNGSTTDSYAGHLSGGPLLAPGSAVSIRCSIHAGNAVHSGPSVVAASSAPSPGVAVLAQLVSYEAPDGVTQHVCTEATVDDTRWYWTGEAWTTDADAPCPETRTITLPPQEVVDAIDAVLDLFDCAGCCGLLPNCIDPPVCEALKTVAGHDVPGVVEIEDDGDIHLAGEPFWDCPPYDEWG